MAAIFSPSMTRSDSNGALAMRSVRFSTRVRMVGLRFGKLYHRERTRGEYRNGTLSLVDRHPADGQGPRHCREAERLGRDGPRVEAGARGEEARAGPPPISRRG